MKLVISNISSPAVPVYVSDLMVTIQPGNSVTTSRSESDLSRMASLQNSEALGLLSITITPTATEVESGTLAPIPPLFIVEEWVAPPVAVANAIMLATATVSGTVTYTASAGATVGTGYLVNPTAFTNGARNVTFTGGGTTAKCPTSAVITGFNAAGNSQTETVTLSSGSGTGLKGWSSITSIKFVGGTGTAGTEEIGFGSTFGLKYMPKPRGSTDIISPPTMAPIFPEIQGGYPVGSPGALDFVNQAYTPEATYVPNGATNNAIYYEAVQ